MLVHLAFMLTITDVISSGPLAGNVRAVFDQLRNVRLLEGTTAGKADRYFAGERTLAASANENLDFSGGFTDASGASVLCARVKMLVIHNPSTTQTLTVKPGATNGALLGFGAATYTRTVGPGGCMFLYEPAGWAITAGTGDLFNVANSSGASVDYLVFGVGTSA